ncbi:thiocillin family RiPP [Sphaerimonospora mesophila]|uniref:thiocillin family RiPP n=1 Tax=Sphaerimonospora mesophila TaxID=37483 RepID=UPI000AFE0F14
MHRQQDLYMEEWAAISTELFAEEMPTVQNAGNSTVATVSSASSASCPFGCVYSWGTASSSSW